MKCKMALIASLLLIFGCENGGVTEEDPFSTDDTSSGDSDSDSDSDTDSDSDSDSDSDTDADGECSNVILASIRDFRGYPPDGHPDFETFLGKGATTGLVQSQLDEDFKPLFASSTGDGSNGTQITSEDSFNQWYHDVEGVNIRIETEIELTDVGSGVWEYNDSTFFPIGPDEGWGAEDETNYPGQNFHFTTEIQFEFEYEEGQIFYFRGDDDLWLFIDGELAIDIGGLHEPIEDQVNLDTLGLTPGEMYRMSIFHAERHTYYSNFKIQTSIPCITPIPPV